MITRLPMLLVTCLATTTIGCSILEPTERVADSMVAQVPEGSMDEIKSARAHRDEMQDASARADLAVRRAEDVLVLARSDEDLAEKRRENSQQEIEVALRSGPDADVARAEARQLDAEDAVRAAGQRVDVAQRKLELARALLELSKRRVGLSEARIELAKASAVHRLENMDANAVSLPKFEEQMRQCATEVRIAEVKVKAAEEEVALAEAGAPPKDATLPTK